MKTKNQNTFKKRTINNGLLTKRYLPAILVGALIVFAITFMFFTPSLNNGFVNWDDNVYLQENPFIRSLSIGSIYRMFIEFHAGLWLPLAWISHALDYAIWGFDPFGHHLTSIVIHALSTVLLFLFFIQLIVKVQVSGKIQPVSPLQPVSLVPILAGAGVAALFFGVHPLRVESVVWACERKDVLCVFFYLLSLICYVFYVLAPAPEKRKWYVAVLVMFIFALLSKPMAVTLPVILLLLDFYPLNRFTQDFKKYKMLLLEKVPFFILSLIVGYITTLAQSEEATTSLEYLPLVARLLNGLKSIVFYLQKMIIPSNLIPFYPYPTKFYIDDPAYSIAGVVFLLVTASCLWMVKKRKYLFFTVWAYYIVTLLPVIGIVQVGKQAAADRFTYLPSVSIFLLLGIGVWWVFNKILLTKQKVVFSVLFLTPICTIFILMGRVTVQQINIWENSEVLWTYVIDFFPDKIPLAHNNLGHAYYEQGRLDEAIEQYKKALTLHPDHKLARFNLGFAYAKQGNFNEAIEEYKYVINKNPLYFSAYYNLGYVYYEQGRLNEAVEAFQKALFVDPHHALTHNNLGLIYEKKGDVSKAISEYEQAIKINSGTIEAHYNLGNLFESQGLLDKAIVQYEKVLLINPNRAEAHKRLGKAYEEKGLVDKAIAEYKQALAINPNYFEAQNNLAALNMKKGSADNAITNYQRAITLNPDNAKAYSNLAAAYSKKRMFDEAISACKKAIALDPNYAMAYFNLGSAYGNKGMMEKAITTFEQAITINPRYAKAYNSLALAYFSAGNYKLAIKYFDRAKELGVNVNPKIAEQLKLYR